MNPLSKESKAVLREVYSRGIARGRDLRRATKLEAGQLKVAIDDLTRAKLIVLQNGASSVGTEEDALSAYISPLPSGKSAAEYALSQPD